MFVCLVCKTVYPQNIRRCITDGTLLVDAKKKPNVSTKKQENKILPKIVCEQTDANIEKKPKNRIPKILLDEDVYSASDLIPCAGPKKSPKKVVLVKNGKFLPPVSSEEFFVASRAFQDQKTQLISPKIPVPLPVTEEGFYSASDLISCPNPLLSGEQASKNANASKKGKLQFSESTKKKNSYQKTLVLEEGQTPSPPSIKDSRIGMVIKNYEIQERLGVGGTGAVYRATHLFREEEVAIKVLYPRYALHHEAIWRLLDEAQATQKIRHANIVKVKDVGRLPDKTAYLIMELLTGRDLGEYLKIRKLLLFEEVREIFLPVCKALKAAHVAGIIHRDLKPDNIFLGHHKGKESSVKILDFGIAKLSKSIRQHTFRTQLGTVLGTPAYMSPEQASGASVDARSDIYSLGVMLYQCLIGELPFRGTLPGDILVKQVFENPQTLQQRAPRLYIPNRMSILVQRCLEKEPEQRPQSVHEILQVLEAPNSFEASSIGQNSIQRLKNSLRHIKKIPKIF